MEITIQGRHLVFMQVPIVFRRHGIVDLFAQKNNKTLAETLANRRYASLSREVNRRYPGSLNEELGVFLHRLKKSGDPFYLRFLNEYGDRVFCDFSVPSTAQSKSKGLYCFVVGEDVKYIGRSRDPFEKRLNQGYGHISPKNCFLDGQSTNCRVNALIARHSSGLSLFICALDDDVVINQLEKSLIRYLQPEWNILR